MNAGDLITIEDLADQLGVSVDLVKQRCGDPVDPWPHLRPSRTVWKFTADDRAEIVRRLHVTGTAADAWGRTRRRSA